MTTETPAGIEQAAELLSHLRTLTQNSTAEASGYLHDTGPVAVVTPVSACAGAGDGKLHILGRDGKDGAFYLRAVAVDLTKPDGSLPPHAWGEWQPVSLPPGGNQVAGAPRPMVLNGRAYVLWAAREENGGITVYEGHRLMDGQWSAPQKVLGQEVLAGTDVARLATAMAAPLVSDRPQLVLSVADPADFNSAPQSPILAVFQTADDGRAEQVTVIAG
ncbi:neuraminidase-like domain-containing protein [Streptomyces sp. NPDC051546]|uniref:neuraminidase-like domain-containing protein n=1 Tax=Streptomyces sp. NPDC051546 TaxID=3365655 RepID=UPI0037A4F524